MIQRGGQEDKRPPFAVALPSASFGVAAFAEAWEYEDEDEETDEDYEEYHDMNARRSLRGAERSGKTVGVLERKANTTIVGGEVVVGKSATGNVKVSA
jgi:dynactin 4